MTEPALTVRRATLADVPRLRQLWSDAGWPVAELEKRFTEFQVIETSGGVVVAAMGLHLDSRHGRLHSEVFAEAETREEHRARLWERLQAVARNHGLVRLWVASTPGWRRAGFVTPDAGGLERLPAAFGGREEAWLTLILKEEATQTISLEKELEIFQMQQREDTERLMQQARMWKGIAVVVSVIFFVIVIWGLFVLVRRNPAILHGH